MEKEQNPHTKNAEEEGMYIEVWEDLVSIKDLLLSLTICSVTTLGGYFIAPDESPKPLFFGLIGIVVGFLISSIIIKPKRTFEYTDEEE